MGEVKTGCGDGGKNKTLNREIGEIGEVFSFHFSLFTFHFLLFSFPPLTS